MLGLCGASWRVVRVWRCCCCWPHGHTVPWHAKRSNRAGRWSRFGGKRPRLAGPCCNAAATRLTPPWPWHSPWPLLSRSRQYRRRRVHGRASQDGREAMVIDYREVRPGPRLGNCSRRWKAAWGTKPWASRHGSRFGGGPSAIWPLTLERRGVAGGQDRRKRIDAGRGTGVFAQSDRRRVTGVPGIVSRVRQE